MRIEFTHRYRPYEGLYVFIVLGGAVMHRRFELTILNVVMTIEF